jgi:hypothetical protein
VEELTIRNRGGLELAFHSRQFRKDGWLESYDVTLKARDFLATTRVDNGPYGTYPPDFFRTLSDNWTGWAGTKTWGALEGEYSLCAEIDSTGHVALTVEVNPHRPAPGFTAILMLVLEAGQLEELTNQLHQFFWKGA